MDVVRNTFFYILSLFLSIALNSNAASIKAIPQVNSAPHILIQGEIVEGDYKDFFQVAKNVISHPLYEEGYLFVNLNSSGGDAREAMKIGRLLRDLLGTTRTFSFKYYDLSTSAGKENHEFILGNTEFANSIDGLGTSFIEQGGSIPKDKIGRCYSACALIFYAGVNRHAGINHYHGSYEKGVPTLGLHRPYVPKEHFSNLSPIEAKSLYSNIEKAVTDYLTEMGAPAIAIEKMIDTPSDDIFLVPYSENDKYYSKTAPFYEEWLIAKCGSEQENSEIVGIRDAEYIEEIEKIKFSNLKKERSEGMSRNNEIDRYLDYFPADYDYDRYDKAIRKVRLYNQTRNKCRSKAVLSHQRNWAKSN